MNPFYTSHALKSGYESFQAFWLGAQFYDKFLCTEQIFISEYEYILNW